MNNRSMLKQNQYLVDAGCLIIDDLDRLELFNWTSTPLGLFALPGTTTCNIHRRSCYFIPQSKHIWYGFQTHYPSKKPQVLKRLLAGGHRKTGMHPSLTLKPFRLLYSFSEQSMIELLNFDLSISSVCLQPIIGVFAFRCTRLRSVLGFFADWQGGIFRLIRKGSEM